MERDYRHLSFWHDSLPQAPPARPAVQHDIQADVAIVGAGYTGLWTAYYLKQADPALDIVVLEAGIAGGGASGRNGGWCSAHLAGIEHWLDDAQQRDGALRLQRLMFDTVQQVGRVAAREAIDCHFERSGSLQIAVLPVQLRRLRAELAWLRALGFGEDDYRFLDAAELRELVTVDRALGALLTPHCAAIHPARLAVGLAACVERLGVRIYQHSPVSSLQGGLLATPGGKVRAGTTVLATEGYTARLAEHRRRLIPIHSMMVATEPLSGQQLAATGIGRRFTFGNMDRVVTYGQLTADRRIAFGCRGTYFYGSGIRTAFDANEAEFARVRATLLRFFPALQGVRFSHAWGGALGASRGMRPAVCYDPARRLAWAGGYLGSGVAATHLAGQTLADLVSGRATERLRTPWVNPPHAQRSWEPEPLRWLGVKSARQLMAAADYAEYRGGAPGRAVARAIDLLLP
jgi:glycine/D-amino acid oxidase-like deaminating enzyme